VPEKEKQFMFNGRFWAEHFKRVFSKQIIHFCAAFETRFLPTFDSLEAEAEQVSEAEWERLGQVVDPEYADQEQLAEQAQEAGVEYYMLMDGVRQAIINLAVAALYHLFEQQLLLFHRREVLHPTEEDDKNLMKIDVFKARLSAAGIEVTSLSAWPKIEELRFVANAIKHAEGTSADRVRQLRPDLFTHPQLSQSPVFSSPSMSYIYMPLAGEDIFLKVSDLKLYRESLLEFWKEFGLAIQ
jgi:hypothetical protein